MFEPKKNRHRISSQSPPTLILLGIFSSSCTAWWKCLHVASLLMDTDASFTIKNQQLLSHPTLALFLPLPPPLPSFSSSCQQSAHALRVRRQPLVAVLFHKRTQQPPSSPPQASLRPHRLRLRKFVLEPRPSAFVRVSTCNVFADARLRQDRRPPAALIAVPPFSVARPCGASSHETRTRGRLRPRFSSLRAHPGPLCSTSPASASSTQTSSICLPASPAPGSSALRLLLRRERWPASAARSRAPSRSSPTSAIPSLGTPSPAVCACMPQLHLAHSNPKLKL